MPAPIIDDRNDVTQMLPLVDAIPPIRGTRGRPLRKPKVIYAAVATSRMRIVADFASAGHRQAPHRTRQWLGQMPLGRRTELLVTPWFPPPSHSVRTPL